MNHVADSVRDIIEELRSLADPENVKGQARFGINTVHAFGISMPTIRSLAKVIGRNHALALELWNTKLHDAQLLCAFIDEIDQVTPEQMDLWAADFDSWDVTDQVCNNLFSRTPHATDKIEAWSIREEEFVRRSAFALIASLAVHGKKLPDEQFIQWTQLIEQAADDERNFVKKSVNWALRQIGKRNPRLYSSALSLAEKLSESESRSARWIGRDAVRELRDPKIIERVNKK
ncbi:MAG: DNA alkylation repair protein [Ignavibacteria bacterium]|nr:MAG: DNA alkylation repair protein [Ignavibacteria bacterium]